MRWVSCLQGFFPPVRVLFRRLFLQTRRGPVSRPPELLQRPRRSGRSAMLRNLSGAAV